MATVRTPQNRELEITAEDALWLARALAGEGPPHTHIAQTLVNRWAWLADFVPGTYPTLTSLVRAYAQPVNPAWFPGGEKFQDAYAAETSPEKRASMLAKAVHRRDVHQHRTKFPPVVVDAVNAALRGPLVISPGSVEYAPAGRAFPVIRPAASVRENSIYGDRKGRADHALYSVLRTGQPWGPSSSAAGGSVLAVIALIMGGGYALSKVARKARK